MPSHHRIPDSTPTYSRKRHHVLGLSSGASMPFVIYRLGFVFRMPFCLLMGSLQDPSND
jgi:hypothetical protein